jgi:2-polyprenyl-3-methyl-5-hydroxy-6-metoxy-1,4-benzoquinol methylase
MNKTVPDIICLNCQSSNTILYAAAKDVEYFTTDDEFQYHLCKHCKVIFIDPIPAEKLQVIYPANYYSFTNENRSISFAIKNWLDKLFFKSIFKKITAKKINILDAGGGTGWLIDSIKKFEPRIAFSQIIDIDKAAEQKAIAKGHNYFLGRFEVFHSNQKFHVILLLNFIEHVADPKKVLQKAYDLLDEDGVIIIKTPNYDSLDARLFRSKNWGGYHCPRHWVIFNKQSAENLFFENKLHTEKFAYTQGAPFWTVSILHYMQQRKWIKANAAKPLIYHPLFTVISILTAAFDFLRKPFAPLSQMFFVLKKYNKE